MDGKLTFDEKMLSSISHTSHLLKRYRNAEKCGKFELSLSLSLLPSHSSDVHIQSLDSKRTPIAALCADRYKAVCYGVPVWQANEEK